MQQWSAQLESGAFDASITCSTPTGSQLTVEPFGEVGYAYAAVDTLQLNNLDRIISERWARNDFDFSTNRCVTSCDNWLQVHRWKLVNLREL